MHQFVTNSCYITAMREEQKQLGSLEAVQIEELLLNLFIMWAASLERFIPACLPQHSYRKKFTLMIMCSASVIQAILDTAMCTDQQLNDK